MPQRTTHSRMGSSLGGDNLAAELGGFGDSLADELGEWDGDEDEEEDGEEEEGDVDGDGAEQFDGEEQRGEERDSGIDVTNSPPKNGEEGQSSLRPKGRRKQQQQYEDSEYGSEESELENTPLIHARSEEHTSELQSRLQA